MSAISLKSITGITSITTPAGVDNQLTLHNNNTSEAAKIDVAGNVHVNNHLAVAGVSTFSGNVVLGDASSDNITLNARINSSFIPNANGVMHIGTPSLQWGDLHINGHTNLDNVSIAGVTTTSGNIIIENAEPSLFLTDTNANPDYKIFNDQGVFKIYDTTYSATRLQVATNGEVTVQSNANFPNGITLNPGTASVVNTIAQRLGNTTAKIRFPANDTFTVETAGDERFRITSAGKIGIGTDNPKQWVSINSGRVSIDVRGDYYGAWIDGDTQGTSSFNVGRWHNAGGRMRSGGSNDNDLVVETQNTSHNLQLQPSGGSVGIGTISPQKKLHVHVSSGGTPVLITGDVPAVVLNPSAANSSDNDRSHFGQATGSNNFCNGVSSGDTVLRGTNSGKLIFGLGTSIKMLITNDGNLGLGDNAPPNFTGYRSLSIHGSTGGALVFGDDGTDEWEVYGGDGVFKIYDRAATTTRLHLTNSYGQFGLNTSSFSDTATALAVKNGRSDSDHTILDIICNDNQTCRLTFSEDSNSSKGSIRYYYTGDGNYMSFYTNGGASGNERLRITSDGRLFVNTTAVVNTNDFLTIKRPAGNHSVTSLTLDSTTATGSYANAFIFTKSKDYYYNGYIFNSSTGHQGGICARMTTVGGSTPEIQMRIGGSSFASSDTLAMAIKNTGTVQSYYHATSRNGIVQIQQVTSETRYSGSSSSVDLIVGGTFTPRTSAPRFLIMIFCPVNTSDDSDAMNQNTNQYAYGRIEYRKSGGGWIECNNQGSTSQQGGQKAHIEMSPNRTGDSTTDYWSGNRYRMEHKCSTILVTNVGDCGDGGTVQFKLRGYASNQGSFIQIGQPHGYGTDDNYGVQPWGFTVFELAPDSNSYTAY